MSKKDILSYKKHYIIVKMLLGIQVCITNYFFSLTKFDFSNIRNVYNYF